MKQVVITEKESNQRLDKYLLKYMNRAPKSFIYKMLRKKRIKINGKKAAGNELLYPGDTITLYLSDETTESFSLKQDIGDYVAPNFKVCFEDENILVVDKPAGVLSHPDSKEDKGSLSKQILSYLWEKDEYDPQVNSGFVPSICNRLDRNTSGIVLVGKNMQALQELNHLIKHGMIAKYYLTLVKGGIKPSAKFRKELAFMEKDTTMNQVEISEKGSAHTREIETSFRGIGSNRKYSLLEVMIEKGKPHQIRAHLAFLGYPIVGDKKYGEKGTNMTFLRKYKLNRQFLHAHQIVIKSEEGLLSYLNQKTIRSSMPEDLEYIVENLDGFYQPDFN